MVRKHRHVKVFLFLWTVLCIAGQFLFVAAGTQGVVPSEAEQTTASGQSMPRTVEFSGVLTDGAGQALTGVQGVTFALYAEPAGGAPLWLETQNVEADVAGRYSVLLGAMRADGLPQDLFTSNQARWLGVQASQPDVPEQPRILLVSVPYALKAADAETLGGLPATAYVLADSAGSDGGTKKSWGSSASASAGDTLPTAAVSTQDRIAKFVDGAGTLGDSVIYEDAAIGRIGIGGFPTSLLHAQAAGQAKLTVEATSGDAQIDFRASGAGGRRWQIGRASCRERVC